MLTPLYAVLPCCVSIQDMVYYMLRSRVDKTQYDGVLDGVLLNYLIHYMMTSAIYEQAFRFDEDGTILL